MHLGFVQKILHPICTLNMLKGGEKKCMKSESLKEKHLTLKSKNKKYFSCFKGGMEHFDIPKSILSPQCYSRSLFSLENHIRLGVLC